MSNAKGLKKDQVGQTSRLSGLRTLYVREREREKLAFDSRSLILSQCR